MSRRVTAEHQAKISPEARDLRGRLRRMAIKLTSRVLWQLLGHKTDDGTETVDAEVFSGIGFYARPRTSDRAEAIVVNVGGASHPAIVATRNEDVRREVANIAADETAVFNSQATIHVMANGEIHIRSKDGTAVQIPRFSDVESIRNALDGHTHGYTDDGSPAITDAGPSLVVPTPLDVLKGE